MQNSDTCVISGVKDFDLSHTFECGQCFRWAKNEDGSYTGIAHSRAVRMSLVGNDLIIYNTSLRDVENIWVYYLDLERDYSKVKETYKKDKFVSTAMDFGYGIHILNQDVFECIISFIISSQNQIPRIKKIVAKLCEMYGKPCTLSGETFYSFPELSSLCGVKEEDLSPLKAGYRASYIVDAVNKLSNGEVDMARLKDMPYPEAKKELMKIRGIGPKVADCILLFSLGKSEAFPIDVWVQRTMRTLYLGESATNKEIEKRASELFGEYAGFAQQYLFYYARENGGFGK